MGVSGQLLERRARASKTFRVQDPAQEIASKWFESPLLAPWSCFQTSNSTDLAASFRTVDSKFRQNYALCRLTVCTINTVCRLHRVKPVQEYLGGVPMTVFTLRVGGIGEHQHSKMSHRETFPPPQYAPSTQ